MDLLHYLALLCVLGPAWLVIYYVVPYFTTYKSHRAIPGPFLAKFSNIWLAWQVRIRSYLEAALSYD